MSMPLGKITLEKKLTGLAVAFLVAAGISGNMAWKKQTQIEALDYRSHESPATVTALDGEREIWVVGAVTEGILGLGLAAGVLLSLTAAETKKNFRRPYTLYKGYRNY